MKLSTPVFILKQQAKALSRREKIPLHQALDRLAKREGFKAWSLLAEKVRSDDLGTTLLEQLRPGDLMLLAARPGQGKTLLSLDLATKTMRRGHRAAFYTLCATKADVAKWVGAIDEDWSAFGDRALVDDSDDICADYIVTRLGAVPARTLVIVDYLQLLDEKRKHPELMVQVRQLKYFAQKRQVIIVCLSQVDRSYDPSKRACPRIGDVRLPNPLDLGVFDRACFLNQGRARVVPSV